MSGFITTMFVSSPSSAFLPAFPAKPKPLVPIFTFAQSQSCMNLSMDLDVRDIHDIGLDGDTGSEISHSRSALDLARPRDTYQSPLQRAGNALRIKQAAFDLTSNIPPPTPTSEQPTPLNSYDPVHDFTNYSYKLLPEATTCTTNLGLGYDAALDTRDDRRGSVDTGSIIGPAARARAEAPRNRGYFSGTSLLSSFFSNPRTRAPFKPQKSNRGTSSWQLKQYAEATLGSGSLRKAVKLPEGEDKDEWLAVNGMTQ
jgi:MOB kinase activator 1